MTLRAEADLQWWEIRQRMALAFLTSSALGWLLWCLWAGAFAQNLGIPNLTARHAGGFSPSWVAALHGWCGMYRCGLNLPLTFLLLIFGKLFDSCKLIGTQMWTPLSMSSRSQEFAFAVLVIRLQPRSISQLPSGRFRDDGMALKHMIRIIYFCTENNLRALELLFYGMYLGCRTYDLDAGQYFPHFIVLATWIRCTTSHLD